MVAIHHCSIIQCFTLYGFGQMYNDSYMDLDKCIMIAIHHCSIIQCFTGLKTFSALPVHLYIPSNPSQQLIFLLGVISKSEGILNDSSER